MGLEEDTIHNINLLVEYWKYKNIEVVQESSESIEYYINTKAFIIPDDFKVFYLNVNGMMSMYPDEIDDKGFLFYPIQFLISTEEEFGNTSLSKIIIFAEYMHKSWWYGFEMKNDGSYIIGILPDRETFKPITNTLSEFIPLYLNDSPLLYDYS